MEEESRLAHICFVVTEFPVTPDYGEVVYGGCRGFAKGVMSWPQDLIIGGARRGDKKLKSAEALQSVFLVASPNDRPEHVNKGSDHMVVSGYPSLPILAKFHRESG
uniref:Uncharacterized protein n=1 Tax=Parascaris equorum TaxID=6256 RepID=A0A914RH44_PAREQ